MWHTSNIVKQYTSDEMSFVKFEVYCRCIVVRPRLVNSPHCQLATFMGSNKRRHDPTQPCTLMRQFCEWIKPRWLWPLTVQVGTTGRYHNELGLPDSLIASLLYGSCLRIVSSVYSLFYLCIITRQRLVMSIKRYVMLCYVVLCCRMLYVLCKCEDNITNLSLVTYGGFHVWALWVLVTFTFDLWMTSRSLSVTPVHQVWTFRSWVKGCL